MPKKSKMKPITGRSTFGLESAAQYCEMPVNAMLLYAGMDAVSSFKNEQTPLRVYVKSPDTHSIYSANALEALSEDCRNIDFKKWKMIPLEGNLSGTFDLLVLDPEDCIQIIQHGSLLKTYFSAICKLTLSSAPNIVNPCSVREDGKLLPVLGTTPWRYVLYPKLNPAYHELTSWSEPPFPEPSKIMVKVEDLVVNVSELNKYKEMLQREQRKTTPSSRQLEADKKRELTQNAIKEKEDEIRKENLKEIRARVRNGEHTAQIRSEAAKLLSLVPHMPLASLTMSFKLQRLYGAFDHFWAKTSSDDGSYPTQKEITDFLLSGDSLFTDHTAEAGANIIRPEYALDNLSSEHKELVREFRFSFRFRQLLDTWKDKWEDKDLCDRTNLTKSSEVKDYLMQLGYSDELAKYATIILRPEHAPTPPRGSNMKQHK
jgi:hypothetical protein